MLMRLSCRRCQRAGLSWAAAPQPPSRLLADRPPLHLHRAAPQEDEEWVASTSPDGPLHALGEEQEGDLCGPRPERGPPSDAGDGELGGLGNLSTNPELLQLMQSLVGQRIFG
jgi:hypothetical protein